MRKHQRHNAASNGQQILLDLQNYVLFLPACGSLWINVQVATNGDGSKPYPPVVHIKIAGLNWMFIPLKMVLIGIDPYPHYSSIFVGGRVQKDVCFARHMGMDWLQLHCFTNLENNLFRQQQEHWTGNSDGNTPSVQNSGSAMCVRVCACVLHFSDFRWLG